MLRCAAAWFDRTWIEETFEIYRKARGRLITDYRTACCSPLHMQSVLHGAKRNTAVAKHFVEGFDEPPRFFSWLFEREALKIE